MEKRPVLDIPIFHKLYDLYKMIQTSYHFIPKNQRYTIWQRCDILALDMLEIVIKIGQQLSDGRMNLLSLLSTKLDLLKVFIRLAKDTRALDQKRYLALQTLLQEIGKMLGDWIKSVPH